MQKTDTTSYPCIEQTLKVLEDLEKVYPNPFLEERIMATWEREQRKTTQQVFVKIEPRLELVN